MPRPSDILTNSRSLDPESADALALELGELLARAAIKDSDEHDDRQQERLDVARTFSQRSLCSAAGLAKGGIRPLEGCCSSLHSLKAVV